MLDKGTDAELANKLGISRAAISHYTTGRRVMDDEACLAVALQLGLDPMEVLGAAFLDRAEKTGQRSLWEVFMNRAAATAGAVLVASSVNVFLTPNPANAASMRVSERPIPVSIDYARLDVSTHKGTPVLLLEFIHGAQRSYLKLRTRGTLIYRLGVKAPFSPSSLYV